MFSRCHNKTLTQGNPKPENTTCIMYQLQNGINIDNKNVSVIQSNIEINFKPHFCISLREMSSLRLCLLFFDLVVIGNGVSVKQGPYRIGLLHTVTSCPLTVSLGFLLLLIVEGRFYSCCWFLPSSVFDMYSWHCNSVFTALLLFSLPELLICLR